MSGEIIDIDEAREARRFKAKEDKLKKIRDAFRAARLSAKPAKKTTTKGEGGGKKSKKKRPPSKP